MKTARAPDNALVSFVMDWSDQGIVLSARRHGESSAVVTVLSENHGAHAGLVRGGWGRRNRHLVEPGNRVHARWRGRLAEHLGAYTLELDHAFGAALMQDPLSLAAMSAAISVAEGALAEREPHAPALDGLNALLGAMELGQPDDWLSGYVKWELGLLGELGYGLDFSVCAATGSTEDLIYVSPKSGCAVSMAAGEAYRKVLLPLPEFLKTPGAKADGPGQVLAGLKLTGHFLERHVFALKSRHLPAARARFLARLSRLESA